MKLVTDTGYDYTKTYWNSQGKFQKDSDKLIELIPASGAANDCFDKFYKELINGSSATQDALNSLMDTRLNLYDFYQTADIDYDALEKVTDAVIKLVKSKVKKNNKK